MMCVQEFVILVFEIFFDSGHTESKPSVVSPQIWQVYCVAMRQNTFFFFLSIISQAPVAHTRNPSYSASRDQDSKPAQVNGLQDSILKSLITKKGW
jgi:hypothetical protein